MKRPLRVSRLNVEKEQRIGVTRRFESSYPYVFGVLVGVIVLWANFAGAQSSKTAPVRVPSAPDALWRFNTHG